MKQWAGGGAPAGPPPPPAPPHPAAPGAPPPAPASPDAMIGRAYQAIGKMIMDGGLPPDVVDLLTQANQALMESKAKGGAAPPPPPPAAPAAPPPGFPPGAGK